MNKTFLLCTIAALVVLTSFGCGGRRRGSTGPGVDLGMRDLGPDPMVDLGGIVFDLGSTDLGGPVDLGRPPDLGRPMDLGRVDLGGGCATSPVDYVAGPFCTAATRTCATGCSDGPCVTACLRADPSVDCNRCSQQNLVACATQNGCQSEWDLSICCIDLNCPAGSPTTCADSFCPTELTAFTTCANSVLPTATCTNDLNDCF